MSRRLSNTRVTAFSIVAALALVAGCGSTPVKSQGPDTAATADGALTVVGWSLRDQTALGVQGVLRAEGGREVAPFDTRIDPARGKTFEHLAAGHYRIEVTHRAAGDRVIAAAAAEELDIQPGQTLRHEIAVDDRAAAAGAQNGAER